ncbi:MAG: late competence development ComFB family protein [Oscillospiraceae bacterium]
MSKVNKAMISKELMYKKIMPSSLDTKSIDEPEIVENTKSPTIAKKSFEQRELLMFNLMEEIIDSRLGVAFKKFNCCQCDRCKKDVLALSLNDLPSKYIVSNYRGVGDYENKIDIIEINRVIIKAILKVRENPRH